MNVNDTKNDTALRPISIDTMIGMEDNRRRIKLSIEAAKKRDEPLPHLLVDGSRGLGKTTLALCVANEIGSKLHIVNAATIKKSQDVVSLFRDLEEKDTVFFDEIHALPKSVEEMLYTIMEDWEMAVPLGRTRNIVKMDVARFTMLGATTDVGRVSAPLRDRFRIRERLMPYSDDDIAKIIMLNAPKLDKQIGAEAAKAIAVRSRNTPRISVNNLYWCRDYAQYRWSNEITLEIVEEAMAEQKIDDQGFNELDRKYIKTIWSDYSGGPVGISALSNSLLTEAITITDDIEPYIMQKGLLFRGPGGRQLTQKGIDYCQEKFSRYNKE